MAALSAALARSRFCFFNKHPRRWRIRSISQAALAIRLRKFAHRRTDCKLAGHNTARYERRGPGSRTRSVKDARHQKSVVFALTQNGFEASDRQSEQRWKFLKRLLGEQLIVVEMHAQRPGPDLDGITATDKRVKHKPSLGAQGVHGRTNPEAVGSELHPFQFSLDGVNLVVPNPVTWSVMKLTATRERWVSSQDLASDEEFREFSRLQAAKHAHDVYRVIAMMTMEERNRASEVVNSLGGTDAFNTAKQCWQNDFADNPIPVVRELEGKWREGDEATIRGVLSGWFG